MDQPTLTGLKACGISQIALATSAAVSSIAYRVVVLSSPPAYDYATILLPVGIATSIIFLIFAAAQTVSASMMRRVLEDYRVGVYGGISGTVVGVTGLVYSVLAILGVTTTTIHSPSGDYSIPNILGVALPIVYNASLALTLVLMGMFFISSRRQFSRGELWLITGAIYILEGASQLGFSSSPFISLYYYLPTGLILSGVLGATCLLAGTWHQIKGQSSEVRKRVNGSPVDLWVEGLGRRELSLGALSQILLAVSLGASLIPFAASVLIGGSTHYFQSAAPAGLAGSMILLMSSVLLWISMRRIARRTRGGRNKLGYASVYIELAAAITGAFYYGLTILEVTITTDVFGTNSDLNLPGVAMFFAYLGLLGTFLLIIGAFFLVNAKHSLHSDFWIASGLSYMIIGSLQFLQYNASNMSYNAAGIIIAGLLGAAIFILEKGLGERDGVSE